MGDQIGSLKGILLAGGHGVRLYPATLGVSKHLLVVYNKPMIYYPLTTLLLLGIKQILLICHPPDLPHYKSLLGDGQQWGVSIHYKTQAKPVSIYYNLKLAEEFIAEQPVCLSLGDNIFVGDALGDTLRQFKCSNANANILLCEVMEPQQYGVVEYDRQGRPSRIVEKPKDYLSNSVVSGIYCYRKRLFEFVDAVSCEQQQYYTVTDLNNQYLQYQQLDFSHVAKCIQWFDAGTPHGLLQAAQAVCHYEQGKRKIAGSPDIAARQLGYITNQELLKISQRLYGSQYGELLARYAAADKNSILN